MKKYTIMQSEHKKIERLVLFSHVAQCLSFTKAAEELGISRGHLSAQIKKLESDMGVPLFIRTTRSVRLTNAGENTLVGMDKVRKAILELERNSITEGQAIEGVIKITAPALFTSHYLFEIVSNFKALHPKIEFSIDASYTSHDLSRSDFDLAFRSTQSPPQNMIARKVLSYQHTLCASPDYYERNGKPSTPESLYKHQCLKGQDANYWVFDNNKLALSGWLQVNNNLLLKQLALAGHGIIKVPNYFVEEELADGQLEPILINDLSSKYDIQIIYPQLIHQPKRIREFIKFTIEYFKNREV